MFSIVSAGTFRPVRSARSVARLNASSFEIVAYSAMTRAPDARPAATLDSSLAIYESPVPSMIVSLPAASDSAVSRAAMSDDSS